MDISTEPPHSPPTAIPWTRRRRVSRTGAKIPIVAWLGSTPIRKVATPIIARVMTRVALRPTRSP